ncbi:class I SAM-dependent methyltransferase, partial [Candidatus Omnitrophota bacterium]
MLSLLKEFGKVIGMDMSANVVKKARSKTGLKVECGELPKKIPFQDETFDTITAFDVLEHIDDDIRALKCIDLLLKPRGLLIVTVPAYNFLWSTHDELN